MPKKSIKRAKVRGYRIRAHLDGLQYVSRGVFWQREPHLPPEWEETIRDPRVIDAILIRSGRKFATYER